MKTKQHFNSYDASDQPSGLDFIYCPKCGTKLDRKEIGAVSRNYCPGCQYVQYINPLPGVSVLIEKDRQLLIGKRVPNGIARGKWCLPCGFVEHHENYLQAAHREVLEETGLEIKITSLVSVTSNWLTPDLHTVVTVLTAKVVSGTPVAADDLVKLEWIDKRDSLPPMAFEADEFIIKRYFAGELVGIPVDPRFRVHN